LNISGETSVHPNVVLIFAQLLLNILIFKEKMVCYSVAIIGIANIDSSKNKYILERT
jgi:hypothetical protein